MKEINGKTGLICLLGSPVEHSKSPYMHNLSFKSLGLDYAYMAFDIEKEKVKEAVNAMKVLDVRGFNITMPHKEIVMKYLDEIKEDAKLIGSVNTVLNKKGKLIGHNTDGKGLIKALKKRDVEYKDKKIIIMGAGGAAKAVAIELALKGAKEIVIVNRSLENAQKISSTINKNIKTSKARSLLLDENIVKEELEEGSILINATSIGMGETIGKSIINDSHILHDHLFVVDLIYNPVETKFLSLAKEKGCKTMNGLDMLIYQGALAFKIWTGKDMPLEVIKRVEKRTLFE
ncbi:MAG: shikimate dehydrogenase [Tissierella sp.]|uniref:shikimate dehydrogenase n=1 Tax=Tissierella sp. TaxID=41274 RepID=UPI003F9D15A7